jgi:glycosyltransferase involved in cell wall biosynthesis
VVTRGYLRGCEIRLTTGDGSFVNAAGARKVLGAGWPQIASVVPHGVGSAFPSFQLSPLDAAHDDEPVQFIYLGMISRLRQLETLLVAIQMAQGITEKLRVTFMGPDAAQGFYHSLVEQLGLGPSVTLKPPLPYAEVPAAVSDYDVALAYVPDFPPDWQYYPTLKVQEYRALGLPVIASDFEPNRQFVQQGVNGLLVPNTVEAWAEAMTTFAANRDFLRGCRVNARGMRQGKTWDEIARIWEQDIYNAPAAGGHWSSATPHMVANNPELSRRPAGGTRE